MNENCANGKNMGGPALVQNSGGCAIAGVRVDTCSRAEVFESVHRAVGAKRRLTIMYANVHVLNCAWKDDALRSILNGSDTVYCDGAGIVVGAWLLGYRLPGRMTGADWIYPFCSLCVKCEIKVFICAGGEGIARGAAGRLRKQFPGLRIVGTHHGYITNQETNARLVSLINEAQPDVVLVGMGTPLQERWINENRSSLNASVVWAVGALFDFVAGAQPRGPRWMLDRGLEWLCRLASDPRRLWRRYILGNPLFIARILFQASNSLPIRQEPQSAISGTR